jgi:hypothetical protein
VIAIVISSACLSTLGCPKPESDDTEGDGPNVLGAIQNELNNTPGQLSGTVFLDGRPQAYGTVQVLDLEGKLVGQERAGQTGHYRILDLLPGDYDVVYLSASGNPIGQKIRVRIRPGRFEQLDLEFTTQQQ